MKDGLSGPYRNHKDRHGMGGSEIPNLGVTGSNPVGVANVYNDFLGLAPT